MYNILYTYDKNMYSMLYAINSEFILRIDLLIEFDKLLNYVIILEFGLEFLSKADFHFWKF